MIPVDHSNRRHAWKAIDGRNAVCTRCEAETRVTLIVTPAGVRAAIVRHGPERCPGREWWQPAYSYWTKNPKPAPPWAQDDVEAPRQPDRSDTAAAPGAPVRQSSSTPGRPAATDRSDGSSRRTGPVRQSSSKTSDRSAKATRPKVSDRSAKATRPKPKATTRGRK